MQQAACLTTAILPPRPLSPRQMVMPAGWTPCQAMTSTEEEVSRGPALVGAVPPVCLLACAGKLRVCRFQCQAMTSTEEEVRRRAKRLPACLPACVHPRRGRAWSPRTLPVHK